MSCGTTEVTTRLYHGAVDRAGHRRTDQVWLAEAWERGRVLVVEGDRALVLGDPPRLAYLDGAAAPDGDRLFLGVDVDETPWFAVAAPLPELPDTRAVSLRTTGHLLTEADVDLFTTAVALANWHTDSRFHPRTGEPTVTAEAGWTRVAGTGRTLWPRTDPAMIALVHDGVPGPEGRCLLAHKPEWPANRYSCLAGYVEPGESVEAAVAREVAEEVGLAVRDIRYVTSQPWPFPRSLMLAYTAFGDPADPVTVDGVEIEDARWFRRADFGTPAGPALPFQTSVAYFLITSWLAGK
ncbi:NAD(+) diphosphatase [Actinocatenispora rupis]|uniref:NAD(+) diphosphatase n=1 Tax=Actinocatenispora rupis TaxID=519421 RepID=A0A8J3NGU8_9ACTN|nr:NAD(+) diphosphatase [Actinocatenispora rupis]GID15239.1 NADH pyrophosphatase [Actinocatenispora rupis]